MKVLIVTESLKISGNKSRLLELSAADIPDDVQCEVFDSVIVDERTAEAFRVMKERLLHEGERES